MWNVEFSVIPLAVKVAARDFCVFHMKLLLLLMEFQHLISVLHLFSHWIGHFFFFSLMRYLNILKMCSLKVNIVTQYCVLSLISVSFFFSFLYYDFDIVSLIRVENERVEKG